MEGSMMGGPMISTAGTSVLELDPTMHHPHHQHQHQHHPHHQHAAMANTVALHHHQHMHLAGMAPLATTQQHISIAQDVATDRAMCYDAKNANKAPGMVCFKGKSAGTSDEDEPSFTEDGDCMKEKKGSPWQRMKWTDAMVKLLINVVLYVGEDGTVDGASDVTSNKRKSGLLQKKGKWKSVSRIMNEKGCYVSPQQCEDKFNDLNKRYKRLNDILGKGVACHVVENPSLLDTMDNLTPKSKDDVKKILSSKHLFYKEMCLYHSGCKSLGSSDFEFQPCVQAGPAVKVQDGMEAGKSMKGDDEMDDDEDDEDDADDDDEDDDCEDHDDENGAHGFSDGLSFHKKRKLMPMAAGGIFGTLSDYIKTIGIDQVDNSLSKLPPDQQFLVRTRSLQLEEFKVNILAQSLELEKQRFKWQRFTSKKFRELEQLRQENKKMKLENEQMSLQLKQKELEVECKRSETSMSTIELILERLQAKEQLAGRVQPTLG